MKLDFEDGWMRMAEASIVDAKYVFLDVVRFTQSRSVEAQADIVEALNEIVGISLHEHHLPPDDRILLPTGDGMCIAILKSTPYDLHIRLALSILDKLHVHNINTEDETRRFELRMGINTNVDSLVTDINGNRNLAGAGINIAQRVMNSADGNQILVSNSVYDTLHVREKYMGTFETHSATTKHGESITVHQLAKEERGLNREIPRTFQQIKKKEPRLTKEVAYYLAHALRNRAVMVENRDSVSDEDAVIILLRSLAEDSERESNAADVDTVSQFTYKAGAATFLEQYEYYRKLDTSVATDFAHFIKFGNKQNLIAYSNCFAKDSFGMSNLRAVSQDGKRRLKQDWPEIWKQFDFDFTEGDLT